MSFNNDKRLLKGVIHESVWQDKILIKIIALKES